MYGQISMPGTGAFFSKSDDEDAQPQQMDEKEEKPAELDPVNWSAEIVGTVVDPALIETAQDGRLRFRWQSIPPTVPPLSPNVMSMLAASSEHAAQHQMRASLHAVLPMALHTSTMVMLLAGHFPSQSATARERMWWPRYSGYTETMCRLFQFIEAATHANPNPPPPHVGRSYVHTIDVLSNQQDQRLDDFYEQLRARGPPWGVADALMPLMEMLKRHTIDVIHTLERYLYAAVLESHDGVPPLSQTLSMPCAEKPSTETLMGIRRDAHVFFALRADPERGGSPLRYQLLEKAPFADTDVDGWLPVDLAWDYFHYLDHKGILQFTR